MPKNASANWKNNCVAPRKNDDDGEGRPNASYCHWISTAPVSSVTRAVGSPDRPARSPLQRTHAWRRDGPAFCGAQGRPGGGPGWWKPDTCWPKTLIRWCGHAWLRVGEDTAGRGGRYVSLNGIATWFDKLGMILRRAQDERGCGAQDAGVALTLALSRRERGCFAPLPYGLMRTHFNLPLRGAQRRGNLVEEVEHTSANRRCYGDEIASLRSQ